MGKEYNFTISRGIDHTTNILVSEHELNRQQKQLLVAEVVFRYKELTDEMRCDVRNKLNLVDGPELENDDLPF